MQMNKFLQLLCPNSNTLQAVVKECESWLTSVYAAAGAVGISDQAYRNYPRKTLPSSGAAGYKKLYYGANLDRLMVVKAKYDPNSFFSYEQGLSQG